MIKARHRQKQNLRKTVKLKQCVLVILDRQSGITTFD